MLHFKFTEQSAVKNSTPQLPCQCLIPLWLHSVYWVERRKSVATVTGRRFLYTYSSLVAPLKIMCSSLELDRGAWNCMKTMIYLYQHFLKWIVKLFSSRNDTKFCWWAIKHCRTQTFTRSFLVQNITPIFLIYTGIGRTSRLSKLWILILPAN